MRFTVEQSQMWGEPVEVARGDVWQLGKHRLMCGDALNGAEVEMLLQEAQPDLIFADPPYGIGIDAWDRPVNVTLFLELVARHVKQGGFFAFTHQMPYMVEWLVALQDTELRYKDHVVWVKRIHTTVGTPLLRSHENLFIYSLDTAQYYMTKGAYSDVKVPGLQFDVITIDGIQVYINDLHKKVNGTHKPINCESEKLQPYAYMAKHGLDRSPEQVNFTNVWSFLPEHQMQKGKSTGHATAKPILLMNRLIELCTPEQALIYDAFLGSGTTLMSAEQTGRRCVGMELSPEYCALIIARWQAHTGQQAVRV